ncbi:MAG: GAF domain-containing protein, partial [Candidatus Adiutrix sp.]
MVQGNKIDSLRKLADTLGCVSNLDTMMSTILTEACHFSGAEAGSIYICEGDDLVLTYSHNALFDSREGKGSSFLYEGFRQSVFDDSLSSYVARTGEVLNIEDAYALSPKLPYHFQDSFDIKNGYISRSILTLPLKNMKSMPIGVLQLINCLDEQGVLGVFDKNMAELMLLFSSTASLALERVQLMRNMVLRTIKMAQLRDPLETSFHAQRVGALAVV